MSVAPARPTASARLEELEVWFEDMQRKILLIKELQEQVDEFYDLLKSQPKLAQMESRRRDRTPPARPLSLQETVRGFLKRASKPCATREVHNGLRAHGEAIPLSSVRNALWREKKQGTVRKHGKGDRWQPAQWSYVPRDERSA